MDLSNSTAYPTDSEGPEGLFSVDESLKELLDRISVIPESNLSTAAAAKEDGSFSFSFPPLKSHVGMVKHDLDRPTMVRIYPGIAPKRIDEEKEMSNKLVQAEKEGLIDTLRKRKVNSVVELRRIEKRLAAIGTMDVTEPMTSACTFNEKECLLLQVFH